jgi:hypothetical protein
MLFDTDSMIDEDISSLQWYCFELLFTDFKQELYDKHIKLLYKWLVCKLHNNCLMWDMFKYRKLCLITSWLDFHWVHQSVKTVNMCSVIKHMYNKTLIHHWVTAITQNESLSDVSDSVDNLTSMIYLLCSLSKFHKMLLIICDEILLYKKKFIIWCNILTQQTVITDTLKLEEINTHVFEIYMNISEHAELVRKFTENHDKFMILVCFYVMNSTDLNLQKLCRNIHLFNILINETALMQAISCIRCLEQIFMIKIYKYTVKKFFNIYQLTNNVFKSVSELVAELNHDVFMMKLSNTCENVNLSWWVKTNDNHLVNLDSTEKCDLDSKKCLQDDDMIFVIINLIKNYACN